MELIIAILWYMQLLLPGVNYTQTDVQQMINANQKTIQAVQNDPVQSTQILNNFDANASTDTKSIIEEWKDPPPPPILD